ncbi:MAG: VWA domain-containing protein [Acidobacteriota bacterium]|nr:VWA domain-containing protein [Acidobacteriota bacterium]
MRNAFEAPYTASKWGWHGAGDRPRLARAAARQAETRTGSQASLTAMLRGVLPLVFASILIPSALADDEPVFRSDVSLVRVDVQVLDRDHRAITGLRAEDFELREGGNPQQIRNFASENMPVDVLLLFDVSASMRPHVQRIASAAHQAFNVLGKDDRVAIMVFDRSSRIRLPFRSNHADVERELEQMLRQERFNGGTDITRALLDAADYVRRDGRTAARRAIVILTDDQTELDRDDEAVTRALTRADAVLSLLLAPYALDNQPGMPQGRGRRNGGYGGGWPGSNSGGGMGGPLGGIILGGRGPRNGRGGQGYPGSGQGGRSRTQSAGTAEIARRSGGDDLSVNDASALETTLDRIRQRYALHFHLPETVKPGQQMSIDVRLGDAAARRYPDAELRFRRVYLASGAPAGEAVTITKSSPTPASARRSADPQEDQPPRLRRRPAVSEPGAPAGPSIQPEPPPYP